MSTGTRGRLYAALGLGYAFLYLPIVVLVVFSFNDSPLLTSWSGFSLRWYRELAANERMLGAAGLSLAIAAASASIATVIGAAAGFALARLGRFALRGPLRVFLAALLVMPEVITGVTLLLLFVAMEQVLGWPAERGATTVTIAHATFAIAFVATLVQARLADQDRAVEEAAADLGARPFAILRTVTLPLMKPALAAGWLLAFTLSLDDLVIASFVSGPGATTLPILIFSSVRLGVSPQINALATLLLLAVALVLAAAAVAWSRARRERRVPA
ncbi:MAG: ABC transporter permease subunit [Alphaproteobacteria bacterium]|nr:ABC transporter permease subunit [Alphaproteobacteria bacterium]